VRTALAHGQGIRDLHGESPAGKRPTDQQEGERQVPQRAIVVAVVGTLLARPLSGEASARPYTVTVAGRSALCLLERHDYHTPTRHAITCSHLNSRSASKKIAAASGFRIYFRFGSAGIIVTSPCSSTDTT
jgi:hypothetical protein